MKASHGGLIIDSGRVSTKSEALLLSRCAETCYSPSCYVTSYLVVYNYDVVRHARDVYNTSCTLCSNHVTCTYHTQVHTNTQLCVYHTYTATSYMHEWTRRASTPAPSSSTGSPQQLSHAHARVGMPRPPLTGARARVAPRHYFSTAHRRVGFDTSCSLFCSSSGVEPVGTVRHRPRRFTQSRVDRCTQGVPVCCPRAKQPSDVQLCASTCAAAPRSGGNSRSGA